MVHTRIKFSFLPVFKISNFIRLQMGQKSEETSTISKNCGYFIWIFSIFLCSIHHYRLLFIHYCFYYFMFLQKAYLYSVFPKGITIGTNMLVTLTFHVRDSIDCFSFCKNLRFIDTTLGFTKICLDNRDNLNFIYKSGIYIF